MKTRYWVIAIIILGLLGTFLDKGKDDNIIKSETTKIQTTEAETTEEITLQETTTALETQPQPTTQAYSQPTTSSVMGEAVIAGVEYAASLRSAPDLNASVIVDILKGEYVDVYEYGNEFSYCGYNGKQGYIRSKFLIDASDIDDLIDAGVYYGNAKADSWYDEEQARQGYSSAYDTYITGVDYAAYLRESEDLNSTILAEIPVNSEVRVYYKGSEVSRVLYNGNVGYVRSKFLAQ